VVADEGDLIAKKLFFITLSGVVIWIAVVCFFIL
jgi:hypothetical protein